MDATFAAAEPLAWYFVRLTIRVEMPMGYGQDRTALGAWATVSILIVLLWQQWDQVAHDGGAPERLGNRYKATYDHGGNLASDGAQ